MSDLKQHSDRQKRIFKFFIFISAVLLGGLAYALVCLKLGFGIPCIFNKLTGLECPGCGISRMCLSVMRGDLAAAWRYNPAILALSPLGAAVAADVSYRYIKDATLVPHKWANITMCVMIAALLAFGIIRNLPFYPYDL